MHRIFNFRSNTFFSFLLVTLTSFSLSSPLSGAVPKAQDIKTDSSIFHTNHYDAFSKEYVGTFPLPKKDEIKPAKFNEPTKLAANDRARSAIEILKRNSREMTASWKKKNDSSNVKVDPFKTVTSPQLWQNLELFANEYQRPEKTIVGLLKRTQTTMGEIELINILTAPTTDTKILTQRQNLLKTLIDNDKLRLSLKKSLRSFGKVEDEVYSLLSSGDLLHDKSIINFYKRFQLIGGRNSVSDATAGQISSLKVTVDVSNTMLVTEYIILTLAAGAGTIFCTSDILHNNLGFQIPTNIGEYNLPHFLAGKNISPKFRALLTALGGGAITYGLYWFAKLMIDLIKAQSSLVNFIRQRMRGIRALLTTRKKIAALTKSHQAFKPFQSLLQKIEPENEEALNILEEKVGKANIDTDRVFLNPIGSTLVAFKAMNRSLGTISYGSKLIGVIDAFVSMAELYREHRDKPATYSFVDYEANDKPHIKIENFWHPAIPADQVVTNSIDLNGADGFKDVILTGPNTAGKSSVLKSIALCLLLGQTFGIAPASNCTFTPVGHLNTYAGIGDNLAEGISLFQAEMDRARSLLDEVKNLPASKFSFTVLDEIFTGTEPVPGEAAAYSVGYELAEAPNSITMIATHFPGLTNLEADTSGVMRNLKVYVNELPDGSIKRPFDLVRGVNTQQIAIDLMLHHNFSPELVGLAREVIANPTPYVPVGEEL